MLCSVSNSLLVVVQSEKNWRKNSFSPNNIIISTIYMLARLSRHHGRMDGSKERTRPNLSSSHTHIHTNRNSFSFSQKVEMKSLKNVQMFIESRSTLRRASERVSKQAVGRVCLESSRSRWTWLACQKTNKIPGGRRTTWNQIKSNRR